ncbi:replication initiator [Nocardiopsis baichengensis]|uniref:replication initiator n=1 Tax=Nocardiopsis baichengensis TaxID=280240 RepID=UPI001EF9E313|nr:replication initiator [Nocardiopsis baichengensis]
MLRDDYPAWRSQVERVGGCVRPVRIAGGAAAADSASGEVLASFSSARAPDGVVLVACGDRRASVCPACSERYRRDLWHLVASGMRGREGATGDDSVPGTVGHHPRLFVTLTAPSFGPVHSARGAACRPRRGERRCPHGRPAGCDLVHEASHQAIGTPICPGCWDYTGAVLWNAHAGELWRRTRIAIGRALAPAASAALGRRVGVREVERLVRVSYVKVAEYQRRGLVHLHALVRLDGVDADDRGAVVAPPAWATPELLAGAIRAAVGSVSLALPSPDGRMRTASWGPQMDIRDVTASGEQDPARLAAYLAKYATKTASDSAPVALAHRLRRLDLAGLVAKVGPHLARMAATAWELGSRRELAHLRLRRWAHTLGYRGHLATKSRRFSTTMGALRAVRRTWRARQRAADGSADPWAHAATGGAFLLGEWAYAGSGFTGVADADLAAGITDDAAHAREELRRLSAERALAAGEL